MAKKDLEVKDVKDVAAEAPKETVKEAPKAPAKSVDAKASKTENDVMTVLKGKEDKEEDKDAKVLETAGEMAA